MNSIKSIVIAAFLLAVSTAANAVDMSKPTGTGELTITNISIGSEGTTFDFEGPSRVGDFRDQPRTSRGHLI